MEHFSISFNPSSVRLIERREKKISLDFDSLLGPPPLQPRVEKYSHNTIVTNKSFTFRSKYHAPREIDLYVYNIFAISTMVFSYGCITLKTSPLPSPLSPHLSHVHEHVRGRARRDVFERKFTRFRGRIPRS